MSESSRAPVPQGDGKWDVTARTGVLLRVVWRWQDNGQRIKLELTQLAGPGGPHHYTGTLGLGATEQRYATWAFGTNDPPVDVTLSLRHEHEGTAPLLWANVPLKTDEFYSDAIAQWKPQPTPPIPVPPEPDEPDEPDDVLIEALPGAADLFPLLWLRPPSALELADALLRYMRVPDPSSLALYTQLAALTGPGSAAQKQQAATAFSKTSPPFIADLSTQPAPINRLPAIRVALLATEGPRTLDELLDEAHQLLGETVSDFLAGTVCVSAQQDAWQSVFALALVGSAAQGTLAAGLVDVLRVLHYLQALNAKNPALCAQDIRRLLLYATPALPDAVAAAPLAGTVEKPAAEPATPADAPAPKVTGQWSLLGVGELELARQHLKGYASGELAEVVNLMPRERQERHERSVQSSEQQTQQREARSRIDDQTSQSDAASELADTLKEAMCTEGLVRNLSNVTPSYSNLNLLLTGSASDGSGKLKLDGSSVARLVQRMSEQAAQKVADRVSTQRRDVWREWHERRESQSIDNRDGERLVGVYRWVDRLMRVSLKPQGRRLVLALQIDAPARAWIAEVAAQGPVPLVKPTPLAAFATAEGQGYTLVTPTNYQAWGAQYGLADMPAPPADQLTVAAQINRVTVADTSLLRIPDGYAVASGTATLALASTAFSLAASVGGTTLPGDTVVPPTAITVVVPSASSSTSVGNLTVTPPAPGTAWLGTTVFKSSDPVIGLRGAVPVTVMSDAPLFGLSVELVCQRVTLTDPVSKAVVDPLLVDWQMRVYNQLLLAWQEQTRAYDSGLAGSIESASAGQGGEVQRQVLQAACLGLLCASSATTDPQVLTGLLDWSGMSWHYDSPVAGAGPRLTDAPAASVFTEPASARLFRRFLDARVAWVLLPLLPDTQPALLYALQWQPRWPSPPLPRPDGIADVPVSGSTVAPLEEQRSKDAPAALVRPGWTLRLPLPLIYLQAGDTLPRFGPLPPLKEAP
ncbi:hypothetical protein [Paraburkholderia megapolitana]|uniref:Uncharacterized protein n=1 Tax=Paraburkholderia megapolitana TaxID=420953 RepID=A0A1I3DP10_9BURK|nr:hypothetical protein [Paraburkholderia megapolitana]QDQ79693.1 hypothetical protein FNZ07_00085 [Paraburkholderia megapolitana]SFH88446.1 hypothetical protein SAMN05192543_101441 [Paraburkholderia megapolitana]